MSDSSSRPHSLTVASLALAFAAAVSCAPPWPANRTASIDIGADAGRIDARDAREVLDATTRSDDGPGGAPPVGAQPPGDDGPQPPAADGPLAPAPSADGGANDGLAPRQVLEVSFADPEAATTDLSAAGPFDWVHFGFQGTNAINRKRGTGPPLILMSPLGPAFAGRSSADFSRFIWSDGAPVATARNVQSGFETGNASAGGFQVNVQGDPERPRTVRLFVGAAQGGGRLTARFGSSGAPAYIDRSLTAQSVERNRVYTIAFRPLSQERTLILEWTIEPGRLGNVRLQAVTLAE
jgi:hypothetical protein